MDRVLQITALAKIEVAGKYVLTVYDNGQPISFRGGWKPLTPRDELIARALAAAKEAGTSQRWDGLLRGDAGERYMAAVQHISGYRTSQSVVLLKDMRAEDAQRGRQRMLFAGIAALALALLSGFGWLFTARAVAPIRAAHEQQNAFLAAASHELRTPLQVMQANVDALMKNPPDPARFASPMRAEIGHMAKLTENLLILTSAKGDALRGRFGPVELDELAAEATASLKPSAALRGIELAFDPPASPPPPIAGDGPLLARALHVLIDNAICYTEPGGHVRIWIERAARQVVVVVEDDGPGVSPEHAGHIFERFYRAERSRKDREHSGLGLSIAREIAEQHGGSVRYRAVLPRGSQFALALPCVIPKNND